MSLSDLDITRLNKMCPAGRDSNIGTELDARIELISTTTTPPTANAGNVNKCFTNGVDLYFCSNATTMKKLS